MGRWEASRLACSQQSRAAGEPLAGTAASRVEHWLVLELASAWEPEVLDCAALRGGVRERLRSWLRELPGARLQLVRRPEAREPRGHVFHVVASGLSGGRGWSGRLSSLAELSDLDLPAIFETGTDPGGRLQPTDRELFLVCGHGRRDACCAKLGMPVYRCLRELAPDATWSTSHTGGHRFAPTLVHLPSGLCFGRVEESECAALVEACRAGRIHDPERLRGRCCLSAAAQAAEVFLRRRRPRAELMAVAEREVGEGEVEVEFRERSGERRSLCARRMALDVEPIEVRCVGGKRKPPMAWVVVDER